MTMLPVVMLRDRRGAEWRASPDYQESNASEPGWLLMESNRGEALEFSQVVQIFGFPADNRHDKPYLIGYME